jgi:soluble lytic murein transglycosylase-like protein
MRGKVCAALAASLGIGVVVATPVAASQGGSRTVFHKVLGEQMVAAVPASYTKVLVEQPVTAASANTTANTTATFSASDSVAAIAEAAARWGVSESWLMSVARCESGLNPYAFNGYNAGLFQFAPGTYWEFAGRIGETRSYWNPYGAANVAAFMFHEGLSYEWACA